MRLIGLAVLVALALIVAPLTAEAQADKIWRIGTLDYGAQPARAHLWQAFREGLRDLGYIEGQNIILESRWANAKADDLPRLAEELVRLRVDLVAVASTPAALAMKHATSRIPVVFMSVGEVIQVGLVPSVARPGGNITGVATLTTEVSQKWLELLREAVPIARLGVVWDQGNAAAVVYATEVQEAARSLGITFKAEGVRSTDGLERVFSSLKRDRVNALVIVPGPMFFSARRTVADLAGKYLFATVAGQKEYAEAGMLMAYGANLADGYRRAAAYVDKIFKGAKPGDLPIEQPTKFDLVINLKTAKVLGLTIPQSLLVRADEMIQ